MLLTDNYGFCMYMPSSGGFSLAEYRLSFFQVQPIYFLANILEVSMVFLMMAYGLGGGIGPWFGGYVFDISGSYTLAFITVIVILALTCILFWLASPRKVRTLSGKGRNN